MGHKAEDEHIEPDLVPDIFVPVGSEIIILGHERQVVDEIGAGDQFADEGLEGYLEHVGLHQECYQHCGRDVGDQQIGHYCYGLLGVGHVALEFCYGHHYDLYDGLQHYYGHCDAYFYQDTKYV